MLNKERIQSLFLSAWYPNRQDAMSGLFVRKHAEAVALFGDVTVLYFHADPQITKFEIVKQHVNEHLREIIVYYPNHVKGTVGRFIKIINYFRANYIGYKEVQKDFGRPDIVHVNVLTRTGLLAYWLKLTRGIPYVITEHWTRYLPMNNSYKGVIRKILTQIVSRSAASIMPVSQQLKSAMIDNKIHHSNYQIINNVVEDYFFVEHQPFKTVRDKKQILLVSCFLERAKNVNGLLNAVKTLSSKRTDFKLTIVGTGVDYQDNLAYYKSLNFDEGLIEFTGELEPKDVAAKFQRCDFSILFSNYETFGVVIAESLASGKPMVSTKVGIATDFIDEQNGILVDIADEKTFTEELSYMLDHYQDYDNDHIQNRAKSLFGYQPVGKSIVTIYQQAIKK